MILTITDWAGDRVSLEPKVELYSVRDFMGKELPGLAIVLDKVGGTPDEAEEYAVLTVSFGDFLSLKNGAYIDTNNCYFADQLLRQGIAEDTGFSRHSGFCQYPLWRFKEEFLKGIGGENYQEYLRRYDDFLDSMLGFPSGRSSFYEAEAGAASAFLRDYAGTGCREYFADYFAYYIRLALQLAALQLNDIGPEEYETLRLQRLFQGRTPMEELEQVLLHDSVRRITVSNGAITVLLKNNQTLEGGNGT